MAFERVVEMTVGKSGFGLLISDLHLDFDIERSITFSENSAQFTIYNAKASTRNEVLQKENNIVFKAGYEDEGIGTLFIGNITEANSRREGPDWLTEIQASAIRSDKEPLQNTTITTSYAPTTLLAAPLGEIGTALGLVVLGLENAQIVLPNGWAYSGSTKGALDYCNKILKNNNAALYIDNNTIVIYKTDGSASVFTGVFLDYTSGLLSVQNITETTDEKKRKEKRIAFESLLIPKITPNGLIQIRDVPENAGAYLVEKVHFFGNNYAGDFNCDGEAVA